MRHWPVDTVADRYERDPQFRTVVDMMEHLISAAQMTPTEVREAAILATIRYEQRRMPSPFYIPLSVDR